MEEGIFSEWLKPDGASVREGDELFTLESDKAVQGVPSLYDGILRIAPDGPQPGDVVAVGRILGHILAIGEELRVASPTQDAPRTTVAASNPVSASNPASTQRDPAANASHARARLRISPRARRAARELGLDPSQLQGSGQGGRIVERDVRALASRGASKVLHTSPARSIPNSAVRRRIAQRLRDGLQQTASVTLTTKVDASQLKTVREQFLVMNPSRNKRVPGYTDLLVKLCGTALSDHPLLNASWTDDAIQVHEEVHVGIAVDTEAGLLVPVIRNLQSLSLEQLTEVSHDLVVRARARQLRHEELAGATFTVTNLGMYGIDAFTPLIDPPQSAILGLGRIVSEPAVWEGKVVPREMITLSLTFDHRVVDGAPAARFLQSLSAAIAQPIPWLLHSAS